MFLPKEEETKAFLNIPSIIGDNICFCYPLLIEEIVKMGEQKYRELLSTILFDEETIAKIFGEDQAKQLLQENSYYEYLFLLLFEDEDLYSLMKQAFKLFTHESVLFIFEEQQILLGDIAEKRYMSQDNFFELQQILKIQNALNKDEIIPKNENPMARKFRLKRKKREEVKRKQSEIKGGPLNFSTLLFVLCAYGIGYTSHNIGKITIFALYTLLSYLDSKEKYELDLKAILSVGGSKNIHPEYWIKNLDTGGQ